MDQLVGYSRPVERADHWILPLAGRRVVRWFASEDALLLVVNLGHGDHAELWLRGPIVVAQPGGHSDEIVGWSDPARTATLLSMLKEPVGEAWAWKDGRLEVQLADARSFTTLPQDEGETWSITWRDWNEPSTWHFSSKGRELRAESWPRR